MSPTGEVAVIDLDSDKLVGKIGGMRASTASRSRMTWARASSAMGARTSVVDFDPKTLAIKKKVKAGQNPDGIVYDPASKRVFTFNGRSQDATAINAETGKVAGTIPLGGKPEFPVSDGKGNVYDNIEDKNEIVRIDPHSWRLRRIGRCTLRLTFRFGDRYRRAAGCSLFAITI